MNIAEKTGFCDLLANYVPGRIDEIILRQGPDVCRRRKLLEESQEPVAAGVASEARDLRKVEWQVMRQEPMPELSLRLRDHLVCLRQLLDVVDARNERINVGLRGADPQHVQDDLCILRIVLVPAVVQSLTRSRQRHRGNQTQCDAGLEQAEGQRSVIVAGCLPGCQSSRAK
jgi:hypothetical protein